MFSNKTLHAAPPPQPGPNAHTPHTHQTGARVLHLRRPDADRRARARRALFPRRPWETPTLLPQRTASAPVYPACTRPPRRACVTERVNPRARLPLRFPLALCCSPLHCVPRAPLYHRCTNGPYFATRLARTMCMEPRFRVSTLTSSFTSSCLAYFSPSAPPSSLSHRDPLPSHPRPSSLSSLPPLTSIPPM